MLTINAEIKKNEQRSDKTYNVKLRFTLSRKIKRLKETGSILGVDDLEFYAARHSWATIAVNKVGIDKYTVHAALNHLDDSMKVTDIYIERGPSCGSEPQNRLYKFLINIIYFLIHLQGVGRSWTAFCRFERDCIRKNPYYPVTGEQKCPNAKSIGANITRSFASNKSKIWS